MKSQSMLVIALLIVGVVCLILGVYSVFIHPEETAQPNAQTKISPISVTPQPETLKEPSSPPGKAFSEKDASITINPDGSWIVVVPPIAEGVPLIAPDGQRFEVSAGAMLEITATGQVDIGRGPVGPEGESGYRDTSMDGPYSENVGGLEMWIGPSKSLNRYLVGSRFVQKVRHSSTLTLRVIESLHGYADGNSGAFMVTIRKRR